MTSLGRALARAWIAVTVVTVMAIGGFTISRLHGIFGGPQDNTAPLRSANIVATIPKTVTYELDGPPATTGMVSYVDANTEAHQEHFTSLPWSHTVTTTAANVFANVVGQGDGADLRCRIVVNGDIRDQQSVQTAGATAFCLVIAA